MNRCLPLPKLEEILTTSQLVPVEFHITIGNCNSRAILPNLPCPKLCKIIGQILNTHPIRAEYTTIEEFVRIIGYEGEAPTALKFAIKSLTQSWHALIPDEFLTDEIKETKAYKDYDADYQKDPVTRLEPDNHKERTMEKGNDDESDDDQHNVHALIKKKKMGSSEIRDEEKQTLISTPLDPLGLTYLRIRNILLN
ncbi:hypothetical protein Tco_1378502 [Tanacetum coccineum]